MTEERNPYAAPQATVITAAGVSAPVERRLRETPAHLRGGAGLDWLREAWRLFARAPGTFVAMVLVFFAILFVAGLVPILGNVASYLLYAFWVAGFAIAADKVDRGEEISVGDLFSGFSSPNAGGLLLVGLVYLGLLVAAAAAIGILALTGFGFANFTDLLNVNTLGERIVANVGVFFMLLVLALTLFFLLAAYVFYAPLLVAFHGLPVLRACSLSLRAALRNWLAMTVWGLLLLGLGLATVFTLFLGMLVLIPVVYIVTWVSYRQMFLEE